MTQASFTQYHKYLFVIAYNILGDIQTAEDIVQDTYEKWLGLEHDKIRDVRSYLSKIAVNKAIDTLKKIQQEREAYKGIWLPEPILTEIDPSDDKTIDYAFLVILEKLNPYERAVIVLRELIGYSYQQISELLVTSQENARQLYHRASLKLKKNTFEQYKIKEEQKELFKAFIEAIDSKDFNRLTELLKNDAILYSDGGGKAAAAINPIYGVTNIMKFFQGIFKSERGEFKFNKIYMNGKAGIKIELNGEFHSVLYPEIVNDGIDDIFLIRNPEKIFFNKN
ncbi:MAG: sigma-70 family RNA polymerase sigma factor [Sporocytophaga sp.]|uniref:sigma-70 family RNA polymerase sigma factor n=1 Tax=Sporocytophaga sp. TaxID=2231183 RepID=UPI001B0EBA68|nr:sigma-70 family RNA polymerase sigma factor [Sporocytophaga sp.]MBO9699312.1 sigma-70 family RNA polymerase sigma factor [Sporocytophaga sp.]